MSVANPSMLPVPAPEMSHSVDGFPVFEFSHVIALAAGGSQGANGSEDRAAIVVNDHVTSAARALPARSFTRGSAPPPLTLAVYVTPAARDTVGCSVAVNVPAL